MSWVRLQMISLGSLLIFHHQAAPLNAAAPPGHGCINMTQVENRYGRFLRVPGGRAGIPAEPPPRNTRTCEQAAKETRGDLSVRSVAPWRYSINIDMNRFPLKIHFAECLCQGCIINQIEDLSYNSVPVFSERMVLKKIHCPNHPYKYKVKKEFIRVPIACICAVPKYNK